MAPIFVFAMVMAGLLASSGASAGGASPPVNTAVPSVSGTLILGQQLTAFPGTWTGQPTPTLTYFWQRCTGTDIASCDAIRGANSLTYTLVAADVGSAIALRVRAASSAGAFVGDSSVVGPVAGAAASSAPANTAAPTVTGTAMVGQQLTASAGGWSGQPTPALAFAWQRCNSAGANCGPIGGATSQNYTVNASDAGSRIGVKVTASNSAGAVAAASPAVGPVSTGTATSAPVNVLAPTVLGSTIAGQQLSASPGSWSGSPTPTFAYLWRRCAAGGANCSPIVAPSSPTYTLTAVDVGHAIAVVVVASNSAGSASATSTASATVVAAPTTVPLPVAFRGDFETGSYLNWSTPQCANYGHATNATRAFGNFSLDTSNPGQGRFDARFDLPADSTHLTRCQVITPRTVNIGSDDYYSLMFYLPAGWTPGTSGFWGVAIAELNLQNLGPGGPTIALQAHSDHVTLVVQTGITSATSKPAYQYNSNADSTNNYVNLPSLYAVPPGMQLGVWHELIVHAHWAANSTGQVEVWHRVKGQPAWAKTASLSGYPTLQSNPDGSIPNGTLDMFGAYRAQSTAPTSVWLDGFTRSQSFTAAASSLP